MAGDWIKMRGNLWDDPRIARLCDLTESGEAQVIGSLYWLWATADQHTEDGCMPGLTMRQIDRKTGTPGFAEALRSIGWLQDDQQGVVIVGFEQHNGASAKRRSLEAQRKANARNVSARDADKTRTQSGRDAELEKRREEIEKREDNTHKEGDALRVCEFESIDELPDVEGIPPTAAGAICRAMRLAGIHDTNPGHPDLLALLKAGATEAECVGAAQAAAQRRKGFAYVLGTLKRQRQEAAATAKTLHQGAMPQAPAETAYARQMREKYAAVIPMAAAKAPGAEKTVSAPFIDMEEAHAPRRLG